MDGQLDALSELVVSEEVVGQLVGAVETVFAIKRVILKFQIEGSVI